MLTLNEIKRNKVISYESESNGINLSFELTADVVDVYLQESLNRQKKVQNLIFKGKKINTKDPENININGAELTKITDIKIDYKKVVYSINELKDEIDNLENHFKQVFGGLWKHKLSSFEQEIYNLVEREINKP